MLAQGMRPRKHNVTDETRFSFYKAFDIQPHFQLLVEDMYNSSTCSFGPITVQREGFNFWSHHHFWEGGTSHPPWSLINNNNNNNNNNKSMAPIKRNSKQQASRKGAAGVEQTSRSKLPAQRKPKARRQRRAPDDNMMLSGVSRVNVPAEMSMKNRNMVVKHREMIGTIAMTSAYSGNAGLYGTLQPGLPQTSGGAANGDLSIYSWIQPIAALHEKYRIRRMTIVYEPTCNLSTGNGTVAMSIDYDVRDASPASMPAMINQASGVYGPPYKEMRLNVRPQRDFLYTRTAALTGSYDVKTYDYGFLYVNTEGGTAGAAGRLFVEYEIEFTLPQ